MGAFYFTNNVGKHLKQESASVKTEDKEKRRAQERIRYSQRGVCLYKCGVANGTFYTYFKRKEDIVFALSREMYQEVLDKALEYPGTFMERLSFFMTSFTDRIEKSGLKLCQEWVRNTVDPDLVENEDDRSKLAFDIHSLTVLLEDGIERGELASDAPVSILAYTLADILYGEMLCWDMSGGAYCYAKRTEEFCNLFLGSIMAPYLIRKDVTQ